MTKEREFDDFSRPIPGESLTKLPGGATYEQPPQFTDIGKAAEYMFDSLVEARESAKIITIIKKGATCESIARTYLFAGFMAGKFTPDVILLIARPVLYMIVAIAERAKCNGIIKKYKILNPDYDQKKFLDSISDLKDMDASEAEISKTEDQLEDKPLGITKSDAGGFSMAPPAATKGAY